MVKRQNSTLTTKFTEVSKADSNSMKRVIDAARKGQLVVVVGTGVSIGLTNGAVPSWNGLIENGFQYALKKGKISDIQLKTWKGQLDSPDMDDLLTAAEFVGRKLGSPADQLYARWLEEVFGSVQPRNAQLSSAINAIVSQGIPICTLNYDPLLEMVTGLPGIQISETKKVMSWMRREQPAILHLHGSWDVPSSCILGIRDYETTQVNEVRDFFQRNLAAFNHLLFIGCGDTFADPNFSALVIWLRTKLKALTPQHVALVREEDVPHRNIDPAWSGFVDPLSFGKDHQDLAGFLLEHFPQSIATLPPKKKKVALDESSAVIDAYRSFLLRDCGQMTIEGVSADLETGQRKFDLERLFVPLSVSLCPPEFSPTDPEAVTKLAKWQKENSGVIPFGEAISKNKRLALLALPGGGKTLLLKRLAVAYIDPIRRASSSDELPDLNVLPVLIRCREWRDHIRLPIPTLLKRIGDITGQPDLNGLSDALVPLLKKGQVLLLVDGLDEIHNNADRATFVEHLESFLEQYKSTRIVVTSREAGFNLVAPSLSRFCGRWRLAPLTDDAIELLCGHWHRLMAGDTPAAHAEGVEVAETLLRNSSLRRLAENPLLLTMLLVVKHGAGGLPPDRVSLYGRAVDVLLDTWNIRGHDPLNAKEAVPQLAYVAFQLMCMGKQTATEKELLELLVDAREKHPNIKRYAKDSPHEFLKRVELRSSLLLEAGHQMEDGRTVPFYQFRHLTFQEYLAAVAVTEGHYQRFHQNDTVLTPLESYLLAEEWKEVIPMAAVLARKRAEPLLVELVSRGQQARSDVEAGAPITEHVRRQNNKLGGTAGRLLQCFVEEAEASPQTISSALQLIAFFADGCQTEDDWASLSRGPYGEELFAQGWSLLISKRWPGDSGLMNSCAGIAAYRRPISYWLGEEGNGEIRSLLQSTKKEDVGRGLLISMGLIWNNLGQKEIAAEIPKAIPMDLIEPLLFHSDVNLWNIAIWVWTNTRRRLTTVNLISTKILDTFFKHWQKDSNDRGATLINYAISCEIGIDRDFWKPTLTKSQISKVRERFGAASEEQHWHDHYELVTCFLIAYHSRVVWTDGELVKIFRTLVKNSRESGFGARADSIRKALGIKVTVKRKVKAKKL